MAGEIEEAVNLHNQGLLSSVLIPKLLDVWRCRTDCVDSIDVARLLLNIPFYPLPPLGGHQKTNFRAIPQKRRKVEKHEGFPTEKRCSTFLFR